MSGIVVIRKFSHSGKDMKLYAILCINCVIAFLKISAAFTTLAYMLAQWHIKFVTYMYVCTFMLVCV